MEKELFTLLRIGLETSKAEDENLSGFIVLTDERWKHIGDLAMKQGVLGIVLDGVDSLELKGYRLESLPKKLRLE